MAQMRIAGACCTCQQMVMCTGNPEQLSEDDPLYGEKVANWVTKSHELAGVHCSGSGTIPQGITPPLTEEESAQVRAKVVHH